jgi:DNA repair protein RecN (Recombination protein N)
VLGEKLWQLAARHQILCVTHLPQLAAYGDRHFLVAKVESRGRTETGVQPLDPLARGEEIAAMLGGAGAAAALGARELLARADPWKDEQRLKGGDQPPASVSRPPRAGGRGGLRPQAGGRGPARGRPSA